MTNFSIVFTNALFLLLLIPAFFLTLFPYFRTAKRFRRNRNRVTSIVLHTIVMVLCITMLAGMSFEYDLPNEDNEVVFVVDMSDSSDADSIEDKGEFIETALKSSLPGCKVGVVTFGYDQVTATEMSYNIDNVLEQYRSAKAPDGTATDISSAINYARNMLENPQSAKIVLMSDGIETDKDARTAVATIALEGVRVDVVDFPNEATSDIQLTNVVMPDQSIQVGDAFSIGLTLESTFSGTVDLELYDNGELIKNKVTTFESGSTEVFFTHEYTTPGLHELCFEIDGDSNYSNISLDTLAQNNMYYSYMFVEVFNGILIIDNNNEGDALKQVLEGDQYEYEVGCRDIDTFLPISKELPLHELTSQLNDAVKELRYYDQVILVNIGVKDMPENFEIVLEKYVKEVGGSMMTVGGTRMSGGELVSNVYNPKDMAGTTYQRMLPVQAVEYTPPMAVMIIMDTSGSMSASTGNGKTRLQVAKEGSISALNALSDWDYCGVMALDTVSQMSIKVSPLTEKDNIIDAINDLEGGGGTVYADAINKAGLALSYIDNVESKHIILISDAQPGDSYEEYSAEAIANMNKGITMSIVSIDDTDPELDELVTHTGGNIYNLSSSNINDIQRLLRDELVAIQVESLIVGEDGIVPQLEDDSAKYAIGVSQEDMPSIYGYFGTRAKSDAEVYLRGGYAPLYAQWNYGKGKVGSFMSDLGGDWTSDFLQHEVGQKLIDNLVQGLFPVDNIRVEDISAYYTYDNYSTNLSLFYSKQLPEGATVEIVVEGLPNDYNALPEVQTFNVEASKMSDEIITYDITDIGVHKVTITISDADGVVIDSVTDYQSFSYSKEYDAIVDEEARSQFLADLAKFGNGVIMESASDTFEGFEETLHFAFDPRLLFMIISITLFLLDVAVRKFKFKWPHEIMRERRAKRALQGKN